MADANSWRIFRAEFAALRSEEISGDPGNRQDRWLRAYPQGRSGFYVSRGLNEDFKARFDVLATRAGVELISQQKGRRSRPQRFDALRVWIRALFQDAFRRKSDLLIRFEPQKRYRDSILTGVCASSATYCARLERDAVEKSAAATKASPRPSRPEQSRARHIDPRKELIASLRERHRGALARRICELIDREINLVPARKAALAPLESWRRHAPNTRSWVGFYDDTRTRNRVRAYVNKVPPLKTAKSPK